MHKYKNIMILGTSHIAIQSVKQVEYIIKKHKPKIIALELDNKRFQALLTKKSKMSLKDIKKLGLRGFIINYIGAWAEKKLAKSVGTKPGAEMKKAIELAKENKLKIALIDQDIKITLKRLAKSITLKEKLRFIKDLILAPVTKQKIKFDLKKVPEESTIKRLITEVKHKYPNVYRVLVKERNQVMAKNLNRIILRYPKEKVFAIIGAGHEKGLIGELKLIQNKKQ